MLRRRWHRIDDTVSLMDADLQFGDVSVMLGSTDHTVLDAAMRSLRRPRVVRNLVTCHETGLWCSLPSGRPWHRCRLDEMAAVCGAPRVSGYVAARHADELRRTPPGCSGGRRGAARGSMDIPEREEPQVGMQALDCAIAGPKTPSRPQPREPQVKPTCWTSTCSG
jgi:hypothetical protein